MPEIQNHPPGSSCWAEVGTVQSRKTKALMRIHGSFTVAVLFLGAAQVQAAVAPQEATQEAVPTPETRLQELVDRFNAKRSEAFTAYKKAETEEEKAAIIDGLPGEDWAPEFRALAEEAEGTDTGVRAWIWVLRLTDSDQDKAWAVVEHLLAGSMQSLALDELSGELRYASDDFGEAKVLAALAAIGKESPHETVRARALFTLGAVRLDSSDAAIQAGSRACFETLIADYGALPYRGKSTYKAACESYLFEMDHLQLGMVAPDFEAVDENGVAWKLSDYRGKAVVVDFWGYW